MMIMKMGYNSHSVAYVLLDGSSGRGGIIRGSQSVWLAMGGVGRCSPCG